MALWHHYWTEAPMPPEALDVYLCEQYHCPPSELDHQDPFRVMSHLEVWSVRREVEAARARNRPRSR